MIVETMTLKEVQDEILKDMRESNIVEKINRTLLNRLPKYWSLIIKRTTKYSFWAFEPYVIKSDRGNDFYVLPYTHGKKSFKSEGMLFIVAVFFHGGVALLGGDLIFNIGCLFYRPHFFERYSQRFQNGQETSDYRKGVLTVLAQNHASIIKDYTHPNHPNSVIAEMKDGVGFGTRKDGITVINTYITKEMLKGEQTDMVAEQTASREIYEKQELCDFLKNNMYNKAIIRAFAS